MVFSIFLIFGGAALLSTVALYTRQSLLVAYMLLGVVIGPWGLRLVDNSGAIEKIGEIGIIFLLFLLGLNLQPQSLWHLFKRVSIVALVSSIVFALVGFLVARMFGYTNVESWIIGAAMMFSSTIIGLKLLPTTILHHQHTGEVMIGVLLMQDMIAIVVLLILHGASLGGVSVGQVVTTAVAFPGLLLFAFLVERYVLRFLFTRFDRVREYMFLLAIAWCLSMSELALQLGLSAEIGAFIAGVSIAASPIALYIAESLKPVRDFFLVLFFFAIGASFNLSFLGTVIVPAMVLAVIFMFIKPVAFRFLLAQGNEDKSVAWEVGIRLAQVSEFSLLIAYLAQNTGLISTQASYLIQATTIITFIASSYIVVLRYPTPMATSDKLRRD